MLDFTSSLYLGLNHPSVALLPWAALTTGRPAALGDPPGTADVARRIAQLQGCEAATLASSSLHLFWDLFGMFDGQRTTIFLDEGAYPVAGWGAERAAGRGVQVRRFTHHDPDALAQLLMNERRAPLIVTDGFCPSCGHTAPLGAYLELAQAYSGTLLVDDTQALGILGTAPHAWNCYGSHGGGSASMLGLHGPQLLLISSLAKGFGVPVAALSGSATQIAHFRAHSETRVHSSPPSQAVITAAAAALAHNRRHGEYLRLRLAQRVELLRECLERRSVALVDGIFPVQTLASIPAVDPRVLYRALIQRGVRSVLRRGHGNDACLSLIVTARHSVVQIERAAQRIHAAIEAVLSERTEWRNR